MYNRIEKLRQFGLLKGKKYAEADLELLRQEYPNNPKIRRYRRDPHRYADAILYDLLDVCDADVITDYRELIEGEDESSQVAAQKKEDTSSKALMEGNSEDGAEAEKENVAKEGSSETLKETSSGNSDSSDDSPSGNSDSSDDSPANNFDDSPSDDSDKSNDAPPEEAKKK